MKDKDLLVGSTGFVGGNLMASHSFARVCHSSDIHEYFGANPDLCVYSGVPAAMFLANSNSEADLEIMRHAIENIRKINPQKLVLISSIAVYKDSKGRDENSSMEKCSLSAYGRNRLQLEEWVREDYPDALIVRLPALYGVGLKKNFLYDLHTIVPSMLNKTKYEELSIKCNLVKEGYTLQNNGFYCLNENVNRYDIKSFFMTNDFNALSFTDSRSRYQFYNLNRLWDDINKAIDCGITLLNLCTPPVSAKEVYEHITGDSSWINELDKAPYDYDLHSIHSDKLDGDGYYLCSVQEELDDIKKFMNTWEE